MKHFARRVLKNAAILVLLVALLAAAALPAAAADANVTKNFDSYTAGNGSFTLTTDARIFVVSNEEPTGMLRSTLQLASSRLAAQGVPSGAGILFQPTIRIGIPGHGRSGEACSDDGFPYTV